MANRLQHLRGSEAEHSTFTGAKGEISLVTDTSANRIPTGEVRVHDGTTAGGLPLTLGTTSKPLTNNIVLGSGVGINFNNYGSEDSNSATTVGSNLLDDYEEGTWTPQLYADTVTWSPSTRYGHYVKIGNLVTVQFYIQETASSGTTSNLAKIINLPFASANLSSFAQYGNSIWTSATVSIAALKENNDSTITMWQTGTGAVATAPASLVSNRYLVGSISYYTV